MFKIRNKLKMIRFFYNFYFIKILKIGMEKKNTKRARLGCGWAVGWAGLGWDGVGYFGKDVWAKACLGWAGLCVWAEVFEKNLSQKYSHIKSQLQT